MRVWLDLKFRDEEFFEGVERLEWREFSTLRGGAEHSAGPFLVLYGMDGKVLGEFLKEWVRGYRFRDDVRRVGDASRFYEG